MDKHMTYDQKAMSHG